MSKEDNKDIDFNIRNIFDKNSSKCALRRYEAEKYYIAPYQRGYKWAAESDNDAVCVFMKDLIDASQHPDRKYRLQFITTKKTKIDKGENKEWVLEVIDGQQRLTTLTILLSVLEYIIDGNNEKAISNYKLLYDIRDNVTNFFQEYIYKHIDTLMSDDDWDVFVKRDSENDEPNIYDEQDIFYLYKAAQKIRKMLENEFSGPKDDIEKFREYLLDKVVITLIYIEHDYGIDSAEIFSNLNDNKVELKSSELVKGLILTEVSRLPCAQRTISNEEKIELRAIMGRQWDEISHWANREDIGTFFFDAKNDNDNVLDELLILLAVDYGFKDKISSKNDIFNYFLSQVKDDKKNVKDLFDKLKEIKAILNDWFNNDNIYNSLGYVLFRKKNRKKIPIFFERKNTDDLPIIRYGKLELKKVLEEYICESLTTEDINTLQYEDDSDEMHDLLLAINVLGYENRFDFTKFGKEKWSLEHIFPQKPNEIKGISKQKDIYLLGPKDIDLLKALCGDNFEKVRAKYEETKDIIESDYDLLSEKLKKEPCELDHKELEMLYKLVKIEKLNGIGNMALLTGKDNSSNNNGMFDKKRRNIVKRIIKGSFVPVHTYDVFSKLILEEMDPNLTVWTEKDIDAHTKWIKNKIEEIRRK